ILHLRDGSVLVGGDGAGNIVVALEDQLIQHRVVQGGRGIIRIRNHVEAWPIDAISIGIGREHEWPAGYLWGENNILFACQIIVRDRSPGMSGSSKGQIGEIWPKRML